LFNKKIDPRKMNFGSKINADSSNKREEYHTVKEILSPESMILDNGLKIKLIGIKQSLEKNGSATVFLKEKIRGNRVFMRFDAIKHDGDNNLLCYLYLDNKTFLNAHLIKQGLVDVDTKLDYKYKSKFLSLRTK